MGINCEHVVEITDQLVLYVVSVHSVAVCGLSSLSGQWCNIIFPKTIHQYILVTINLISSDELRDWPQIQVLLGVQFTYMRTTRDLFVSSKMHQNGQNGRVCKIKCEVTLIQLGGMMCELLFRCCCYWHIDFVKLPEKYVFHEEPVYGHCRGYLSVSSRFAYNIQRL